MFGSATTLERALILIVAAFLVFLPSIVRDPYHIHTATMIVYFSFMAASWNFVCGYVGQLSLGHSVFSGVAGYVTVLMFTQMGLSPWIGMLFGGFFAAVLSLAIGFPTFRLKGPYFTLTTIAFAEIMRIWFENTDNFIGIPLKGSEGLVVPLVGDSFWAFQFNEKLPYYYIALALLAIIVIATAIMERSKLGYYLKAIRGDRDGAEALGINPTKYSLIALSISAFFTGIGGAFFAQFFRYINPERNMGIDLSIDMAIMSIIGGQGTVLGPILGSFILHPIAEVARTSLGGSFLGLHLVIYGAVLALTVLYFPQGIIVPLRKLLARISGGDVK
ncbi:branched-chain amino acid ABC transporter permease [Ruegeria atlantica]|uniref:branched-chain amino acid ABC transporter permease n=1 Tax=Ruegeria atlantica TaxID=81569 RepID=UPI001479AA12|nr:branched-chain amino acid ABC transporter permease [Ruegeria atlantica]